MESKNEEVIEQTNDIDNINETPDLNARQGNKKIRTMIIFITVICLAIIIVMVVSFKLLKSKLGGSDDEKKEKRQQVTRKFEEPPIKLGSETKPNFLESKKTELKDASRTPVSSISRIIAQQKKGKIEEKNNLNTRRYASKMASFGGGDSSTEPEKINNIKAEREAQMKKREKEKQAKLAAIEEEKQAKLRALYAKNSKNTNVGNTKTATTQATLITNIDYTLVRGSTIPCVLETNIVSELNGFTSCVVAENVYSSNSRLLLIEKGSRVTGSYSGKIQMGAKRMEITWDRIITPYDLAIKINSPTVGKLGQSGQSGEVDSRWGLRVGSALLISVIADGIRVLADKNGGSEGSEEPPEYATVKSAQTTSDSILEQYVNLPPIIFVKEGTVIKIYVTEDIDLSGIYNVEIPK